MAINKIVIMIEDLKSIKGYSIQKKKNPTYNVILMSHNMSKDFLNNIRKKKELEDIKTIRISEEGSDLKLNHLDLEVKVEAALPANSVIFMKDEDPVAAWISGELKLITRKI